MNAGQSILALTAALVHPAAMETTGDRFRHQMFILRGMIVLFTALAVAPFFLAFHGAPSMAQSILYSLCLMPVGGVVLVSKTGWIVRAHAWTACCFLGIALSLSLTGQASLGAAVAWLILAQMESLMSLDRRLVVWTGVAVAGIFCGLAVCFCGGWLVPAAGMGGEALAGVALGIGLAEIMMLANWQRHVLRSDRAKYSRARKIAELMDDVVVSYDRDGTVDTLGRDSERLLNRPSGELLGRGFFEHIHVADRPLFLTAIADAAYGVGAIRAAFRMKVPTEDQECGQVMFRWIEMRACRLAPQTDGTIPTKAAVIALLRDVTAAKHRESDLEDARLSAIAANQAQDHFIANMSHELRTPLNAIIGFSEMLGDEALRPKTTAKQQEYARIIHQSGEHLLAVVNSILDMSKLQSGTFSIATDTFDVEPLIDSCCDIMMLKAREGRIELIRAAARLIEPIVGDRRACKQILLNLLSNAIKFTPENGRVVIDARPDGNSLLISVVDSGIGIAPADLSRLGDPFFQAKSSRDRPYEGTGLGLSVVRGLVGLHGGSLSIESELGQGTNVTIRLPIDCRLVTPRNAAAEIETIPRRRPHDRLMFPPQDSKVKKSA